ncbi:DNA repair exonuclease [Verrucomicrobia bacterium LW23]|nr:DNA repair exonuclease [Verrucomicrobia bacterium LW23]
MSVIVQLSDTHFGTEIPRVVAAAKDAVHQLRPDVVLISGDLTQRATPSQFRRAGEFLKSLPGQVKFAIPGNHDLPLYNLFLRMLAPYRNYHRDFTYREGIWYINNIAMIGYDATSPWRHTKGRLRDTVLRSAVAQAKASLKPGGLLAACVHQPLYTAWREDRDNELIHADRTAQQFSEAGIDIVLTGHVHVPVIASTSGIFPKLPRHYIMSGAGTTLSHRTRRGLPNSFNVIRVEDTVQAQPPLISITLMAYDSQSDAFTPQPEQLFSLGPDGWGAVSAR